MRFIGQLLYNLGLGIDQFINVLLLGDPDESISGRTGRAYLSGRGKFWVNPLRVIIDFLWLVVFWEKDHCVDSVEFEETNEKELWSWIKGGG